MSTSIKSAVAFVATAAITLALAGCGGGDSSGDKTDVTSAAVTTEAAPTSEAATTAEATETAAEGSSDTRACGLLSADAISSITGADFSQSVGSDDGSGTCTWDDTANGGLTSVAVMLDTAGGVSYEDNRAGAELIVDDVTDVTVAGADHAFTYMGGIIIAMDVKGEYVQVMFMTFDPAITDTTITVKIAEEVAKNL